MNPQYTNMFSEIQLTEEEGELAMTFPKDLLEDLDWHSGDIIEFRVNDDGSFRMLNNSK